MREFEGESLDLQFAPLEFGVALDELGIAFGKLALQGKKLRQDLILSCETESILGRRKAQILELNYSI
jgi:hypothetical protein